MNDIMEVIIGVFSFSILSIMTCYVIYKFFQVIYRRMTIKVGDVFYKEIYKSKNPFVYEERVMYYEIKQIKKGWLEYQSSEIFYRNDSENVNYINFNDEKGKVCSKGYMDILSFTVLIILDYKKLKRMEKNEKERRYH